MKTKLLALLFLLPCLAIGQVVTNFAPNTILYAGQLNQAFAKAVALTGSVMTGPLYVPALTIGTPLPVSSGGTGQAVPSGTALDAIAGFTGTGYMQRTGAGTYTFGSVPGADPQAGNTLFGNSTASTTIPFAIPVPSCISSNSALQWQPAVGFNCNPALAQLAGNVFTGSNTISISNPRSTINDSSGSNSAQEVFQSNGQTRWAIDSASTPGTLTLDRYTSGSLADSPLSVNNSSGVVTFAQRPVFGTATPWDSVNFNSSLYALLSGATFTGPLTVNSSLTVTGNTTLEAPGVVNAANAVFGVNDTSGTGTSSFVFANNSEFSWGLVNVSNTNTFGLDRYVGGSEMGMAMTVANATGLVSFPDGIAPSTTAGIVGTVIGDSPTAGRVGQVVNSSGTGGNVTSGTVTVCYSMSVPPGDWDAQATVSLTLGTGATTSYMTVGLSPSSTALGNLGTYQTVPTPVTLSLPSETLTTPVVPENFSTATTLYAVVQADFSGGSVACDGQIFIRRMR